MSIRESVLRSLPHFADFPAEATSAIAETCVPRAFGRNEIIYMPDQEKGKAYVLVSGEVEIYQAGGGKRVVIHVLKAGDVFGDLAFTDHAEIIQGSYAQARGAVRACVINSQDVKNLLVRYPVFAFLLLTSLRDRLHMAESKIKDLALSSAETRVINELVRYVVRHGAACGDFYQIEEQLTHQSLARMIGVARETATKVLGALERGGVISWSPAGHLRLHQKEVRQACPHCLVMNAM